MDKILKNWHEAGLHSADAVDTQQAKTKAAKAANSKQEKRSYDLDDAVQRILNESKTQA